MGQIHGNPVTEYIFGFKDRTEAESFAKTGLAIMASMQDCLNSGTLPHCICECCDSTLVGVKGRRRYDAELWQNEDTVKLQYTNVDARVNYITDVCPICGKKLPTKDGGTNTNGFERYCVEI